MSFVEIACDDPARLTLVHTEITDGAFAIPVVDSVEPILVGKLRFLPIGASEGRRSVFESTQANCFEFFGKPQR
jgi:hypothetical protein